MRSPTPIEFDPNPAVRRQKESEARWPHKNNETRYGWKNHVKADLKTKLILKSKTTPAIVHDGQVLEELLDDKDQAVLADCFGPPHGPHPLRDCLPAGCLAPLGCACHSAEHEAHLIKFNAQESLMRKATHGHPPSEVWRQTNHTISRMRLRVEHIFTRLAHLGAGWRRSIGLKRAAEHSRLSNLVYNMDRLRLPGWLKPVKHLKNRSRVATYGLLPAKTLQQLKCKERHPRSETGDGTQNHLFSALQRHYHKTPLS